MNFDRCETVLSRLMIRHRDTANLVRFRLNDNQTKMHAIVKETKAKKRPLFFISLKSRRVGVSSYVDGLGFCHVLAQPNANALILSHDFQSTTELFKVPLALAKSLPFKLDPVPISKKIYVQHSAGRSEMSIATAGSPEFGRGWTLSFLHLSECSRYPAEAAFPSLIHALSLHQDNLLVLESTANGRIGRGQPFYDFWSDAVERKNDFTPIFLSWTDDPACQRDPELAKDAPIDREESALIQRGLSKAQLAWRRWILQTNCQGRKEQFQQEFPAEPSEAFIYSGNPAFDQDEIRSAREACRPATASGILERDGEEFRVRHDDRGPLWIWETPQEGQNYYIGADAARGQQTGDFAAAVVWNGVSGKQAARFSAKVAPEYMAWMLNLLGRWYNRAMINVELTGNLGRSVQIRLRDNHHYPNFYRWKGKDDRIGGALRSNLGGWETTQYSRKLMFAFFRESLRLGELEVLDRVLVNQMDAATMDEDMRWIVERGHDDVLVAGMIGWVARCQFPPFQLRHRKWNLMENAEQEETDQHMGADFQPDPEGRFKEHIRKVLAYTRRKRLPESLVGI